MMGLEGEGGALDGCSLSDSESELEPDSDVLPLDELDDEDDPDEDDVPGVLTAASPRTGSSLTMVTSKAGSGAGYSETCGISGGRGEPRDDTYNLSWQGYPLIVLDTTDQHRAFYLIALGLAVSETAADYDLFFRGLKNVASRVFAYYNSPFSIPISTNWYEPSATWIRPSTSASITAMVLFKHSSTSFNTNDSAETMVAGIPISFSEV